MTGVNTMIECGLLFYSKDIEKDFLKAIERYKERMGEEPKTIFFDSSETWQNCGKLKIEYGIITRHHFILTGDVSRNH